LGRGVVRLTHLGPLATFDGRDRLAMYERAGTVTLEDFFDAVGADVVAQAADALVGAHQAVARAGPGTARVEGQRRERGARGVHQTPVHAAGRIGQRTGHRDIGDLRPGLDLRRVEPALVRRIVADELGKVAAHVREIRQRLGRLAGLLHRPESIRSVELLAVR